MSNSTATRSGVFARNRSTTSAGSTGLFLSWSLVSSNTSKETRQAGNADPWRGWPPTASSSPIATIRSGNAWTQSGKSGCSRSCGTGARRRGKHGSDLMRILVTGHRGYIGSILADLLCAAGHDVVGIDNELYDECTF